MDRSYFFDRLYPLQEEMLGLLSTADTGFYLSDGPAASRGYLQHRFSEDLDLFVNDDPSFGLWAARFIDRLGGRSEWQTRVLLREARGQQGGRALPAGSGAESAERLPGRLGAHPLDRRPRPRRLPRQPAAARGRAGPPAATPLRTMG